MGPIRKHKTGVIAASLLAMLYLSAILIAARSGPPHSAPPPDARHSHFVFNSKPRKHLPHPNPWLIRATGWVVSVVTQLS